MFLEDAPQAYQDFEQRKVHKVTSKTDGEHTGHSIEKLILKLG